MIPVDGSRIAVEIRVPWRTYQRRTYEASIRVRVNARSRWRWWAIILHRPQETGTANGRLFSMTLEVKSWLTDESMRGNLRHKAFLRHTFRAGIGGIPASGSRCPVMDPKGRCCTWQRGHLPMTIEWTNPRRQEKTGGATFRHSWEVPSLREARVVQEPRRPTQKTHSSRH